MSPKCCLGLLNTYNHHHTEILFVFIIYLCPCLDLGLFMSYLCDLFLIFIFIFIMINRIILWTQAHLFLCLFFRICPIVLDVNVDEECEKFSNSKNAATGCCLASAWFFASFSLVLLIKVLLIKNSVYLPFLHWKNPNIINVHALK